MTSIFTAAAYGGAGWSPRKTSLRQEIGKVWGACGLTNEWAPLKAVLLHRPGSELGDLAAPDRAQMLAPLDVGRARQQHDALAQAYRDAGVAVYYVEPAETPPPNLMFVADLMFMTPEGAILGRPASTVRAGEERFVARQLAELGIPILHSVRGRGVPVGLPYGVMHLMGQLRFADRNLAIAWAGRVPYAAVEALRARGYTVLFLPDEEEAVRGMALNFVTLGPRRILMAAGNPITQAFYQDAGIVCQTVEVDELLKAAGGIGCLTGVLEREMSS